MQFLKDLPVLVLGLGASGLAMARWCARSGAGVTVWDSREDPPQAAALQAEVPTARRIAALPGVLGGDGSLRLILKSPGLAPHDPLVAPLLEEARAAGIAVVVVLPLVPVTASSCGR